jgi:UDP-N-acetylmuramoylalanine--D-glutamate ligase
MSRAASMDEAVAQAARVSRSGDVVLLSPGGTSYDMYANFEERGRAFARAVSAL